ncbi:phosphoglycerate mutase, 2,3-bisphosphoglycerate-independent [Artemisia annua]|uniref:Phosphoglycerate mutase, 2,3-bisphosphoglycerate-independent n=1 Tax=Artemisia annua TaxID=35608 RepID=A0A2U1LPL5_ARTAN|nr:phosphoglycerate mutase, 2,3-bisphosphoglycerate-independent [Artemisia annua]
MILDAIEQVGGIYVVTANHGNAKDMVKRNKKGEPILKDDEVQILTLYTLQPSVWFPIGCGRSLKLASKRLKLCKFTIEAVVDDTIVDSSTYKFFDVETIVNGGAEKDIGMESGSGDKISGVEEERNANFSLETMFL